MMNEISGFITLPNRAVYATAFLPETPAIAAAVLVEPLAEEKRAAYRMLVRLARTLAQQNIATIRFDLSGTGDSSLPHGETTLAIWLEDVVAVADDLVKQANTSRLYLIAARAGALVAASAAQQLLPDKLVLVEPLLNGSDFLNDLERRQAIKGMLSEGGAALPSAQQRWSAGQLVDFGGYDFNPVLAQQLQDVSMRQLIPSLPAQTSLHAIRVSASKKLPPAWSIFGDQTTCVTDKPFWGQLDYYESDFVNDAIVAALNA